MLSMCCSTLFSQLQEPGRWWTASWWSWASAEHLHSSTRQSGRRWDTENHLQRLQPFWSKLRGEIVWNNYKLSRQSLNYKFGFGLDFPSSKSFNSLTLPLHTIRNIDKRLDNDCVGNYAWKWCWQCLECFQNNSNKAVKKIKVSVRQFADICLFSTAQYKCTVDEKVGEKWLSSSQSQ